MSGWTPTLVSPDRDSEVIHVVNCKGDDYMFVEKQKDTIYVSGCHLSVKDDAKVIALVALELWNNWEKYNDTSKA